MPPLNLHQASSDRHDYVTVYAQALNSDRSKEFFQVALPQQGYQPIHVHIENDSSHALLFRPNYIDLPLVEPKYIAKELHYNTSLVAWSMVGIGYLGIQLFAPLTPLIITAPFVAWNLSSENKKINHKVQALTINGNDVTEIPPYGYLDTFAFVRSKDFYQQTNLMLFDADAKKPLNFELNL